MVIDLITQQEADVVAITGDYVSHNTDRHEDAMIAELKRLTAAFPAYSVLGNHDHWSGADNVRRIMSASGIVELRNQVHTIKKGNSQLHLAGIDDIWEHKEDLDQVLEMLPEDGCALLLSHEPDYADISAPTGRFDLQISGHSHGGQMVLPFVGPPIRVPGGIKYPLGQYQIEDMVLYTNRGLGTSTMPIRINCRPEITIFTLRAEVSQDE
jgi:predicted MPP superfamily phosphohydrolase